MTDKIFTLLYSFSKTFSMLFCVLLFAMAGIAEGMCLCGIFSVVMFIVELSSVLSSGKKHKGRKNEN